MKENNIDKTMEPKNEMNPKEDRQRNRERENQEKKERKKEEKLRQNEEREGKREKKGQQRYALAKQFKSDNRDKKTLRTYLGREIGEKGRKKEKDGRIKKKKSKKNE